ncbi:MAG: tRNA dimethylallyltransferase [Flavobacteriaceae bacterium]|jgi:tRNA dimethylallyltransferase
METHAGKPILICIVGPTAIGKTALSIKLATTFSSEIISADSRQFYKEMRIGSAVPSPEELASTPHHFIQDRSIFKNYSVGDFEKDAIERLDELFLKNEIVVMVGGSGLYLDAVTKGLDSFPEIPSEIREDLNILFEKEGLETLQKELKKVDPKYFQKVDIQNQHRIIRALEVYRATGLPYSTYLNKEKPARNFETIYIGLSADREIIYNRINQRVDIMMKEGLLEEAKGLHPNKHLNALKTVGYRELFSYFDGDITKDFAVEEIKKNTRRFAKRQGTWFRKNAEIQWFNYELDVSEIIAFIKKKRPNLDVS